MSYEHSWDCPHQPDAFDNWQESDCYWFFDSKARVGGYQRIGQFPNRGTGQVLAFAFAEGGLRFRHSHEDVAANCARDANSQRVGNHWARALGNGVMSFGWTEDGCSADLTFSEPFYEPRSWMKHEADEAGAAEVSRSMNTGGHLEVAGRIRGHIVIGGETHEIDALAHRDRSWGRRDYKLAHQHRMVTGTIGPELSWATYIMHLANGMVAKAGFVARHGVTTDIDDIRVLTELDWDGLTVSRLRTQLLLRDGSEIEVSGPSIEGTTFETEDWLLSSHHIVSVGSTGFTVLDITNRPQKGDFMPSASDVSKVCRTAGLSPSGDYTAFQRGINSSGAH
ncbi:DUF7065 domain-containing protein [Novosphingobium cyanobacteriorum]|uniref:Uncharacterized protein n=1 Tax=Novosphingobium cyanobacteriorum TaxID=3024215 RepID=A0ABT6CFE9_9SPHN|nr:hypothetical protein [Novosphingobium cyanobacteriorum]MDF8332213.1 hypothetical protein [Novosphingobium cyanobacteriorum]